MDTSTPIKEQTMISKGQLVNVGTFSIGRVSHIFQTEDFQGFCTVEWGGGFTLELIANLTLASK
jgi:hypothetical protein